VERAAPPASAQAAPPTSANVTPTDDASGREDSVDAGRAPAGSRELRAVTFNAGLAPASIAHVNERTRRMIPALRALSADVVCFQEVWLEEHWSELARAANDWLPRALRAPPAAPEAQPRNLPPLPYAGSRGLGILTRAEVLTESFLPLVSHQAARGVLHAKLAVQGFSELHVLCTHLTSVASPAPYPIPGGSWAAEQARQVDELIAFAERVSRGAPVVVLGDLNAGPAVAPMVRALMPKHYDRFIKAGFVAPYLAESAASCTFCASNPLRHGGGGPGGAIIDHALIKNFQSAARSERVFDQPLELAVRGRRLRTAYSDHYGVLLIVGDRNDLGDTSP
jgi:endonuclease/exonuclease/phosphatase family metal-dependent hydrolase